MNLFLVLLALIINTAVTRRVQFWLTIIAYCFYKSEKEKLETVLSPWGLTDDNKTEGKHICVKSCSFTLIGCVFVF